MIFFIQEKKCSRVDEIRRSLLKANSFDPSFGKMLDGLLRI
jgi:hypothetical protein